MNVRIANELIKIAKLLYAEAVTIDRSVIDYIWNSIKNKSTSNSNNNYTDKFNKTLTLSGQTLKNLFDCQDDLQPLTIAVLFIPDLDNLKEKHISMFTEAINVYQTKKDYNSYYSKSKNMIVIFYGTSNGASILYNNIFGFEGNKKKILQHLRHELIHYYKIKVLKLQQKSSNSNKFEDYINSDVEYDSWIENISEMILNNIKNIEVSNNKIKRIYLKNRKSTGMKFDYYIKNFLKINADAKYNDFLKKGKKDILKAIEQKMLFKYKAKNVYDNIEEAKKDVKNNYFFLYKAVNKNIIKNDDTIIIQIVKELLQHNKIHNIRILAENGKLSNFINEIDKLFELYQYNEKIYSKLLDYDLVKFPFDLYELVNLYLNQNSNKIKLKILDEVYYEYNEINKQMFFDYLNDELNFNDIQDKQFENYCKQKNIKFSENIDYDDYDEQDKY